MRLVSRSAAASVPALFTFALGAMLGPQADAAGVVYTDNFEDADVDNNGYDVKDVDVETNGQIDTWLSANPAYPDPIVEVLDPGVPTNGLRWFAAAGFAGTDPKSNPSIVDDTPGGLPESTHINTGLALGLEGKGRGSSSNAFFDPTPTPGVANDQRLTLGLNAGDAVNVSFDWRVWESMYNPNSPLLPDRAEFRFGLYQDTDHELGLTSDFAGINTVSAVWGEEDGLFRGDLARIGPGSNGDHGIYAQLQLGDAILTDGDEDGKPDFTGDLNRINEEINPGLSTAARYMQGDDADFVAAPAEGDPLDPDSFFPMLEVGKVYTIEMSIVRTVAAAFQGDPNGLFAATVTVHELDANRNVVASHSFGGEESLGDPLTPDPDRDGIQSDVWDYIGFRNSGGDPYQDYDMVIDNLVLMEIIGGDLDGDYNDSGLVEQGDLDQVLANWGADFASIPAAWVNQRPTEGIVDQAELDLVLQNWGSAAAPDFRGTDVPEPAGGLLLLASAVVGRRGRR